MYIIFFVIGIVELLLFKDIVEPKEVELYDTARLDILILSIGRHFYELSKYFVCEFSGNTDENQATFVYKQMTSFEFLKSLRRLRRLSLISSTDVKERMALRLNLAKNYIEWVKNNKIWLVVFFAPSIIAAVLVLPFSLLKIFAPEIAHHLDEKLLETLGNLQKLLETWHL